MRQTLPFLAIAAAAGAMWFFSAKKRFAGAVKFQLKQIKVSGTNVIVKIGILNPSNQTATVKSIVSTLYFNNTGIATVKNFKPVTVNAASETETELIFVPSGFGIVAALTELAQGKKVKGFKVIGNANVDGVMVPVNFSA
jgi:LEA14-like dessication related protein